MTVGLVGCKEGTRQLFLDGRAVQVTFITLLPNRITAIKTKEKHGYSSIQVTTGERSLFRLSKAEAGHFKKANVAAGIGLWEFRTEQDQSESQADNDTWQVGQALTVEHFRSVQKVDVTATSKGKGFAGVIKRHHFSSQDATHGNSLSHRAPGSIGQRAFPGRVFKGKKMAGQLGNKRRTIQALKVLELYPESNLLMIQGSIPGAPGATVVVRPSVRLQKKLKGSQYAA